MVRFNIGQTKPEYVIAEFDDNFTTVNIYPNGPDSDGITKDFIGDPLSRIIVVDPGYPIYIHRDTLKTVTVQEGITKLGLNAFARTNITSITLPSSLKHLGNGCFDNVKTLTSIELPENLETIGQAAFRSCTELTSITPFLPQNITNIGKLAFYNCSKLQSSNNSLSLPPNITIIDENTFTSCENLYINLLSIPEGVTEIGYQAFSHCSRMICKLSLPSTLKKISAAAFQNCSFTGKLELPEGLEYIGDFAFNHCKNFSNRSLRIPSTVAIIGGDTESKVTPYKVVSIKLRDDGDNTGIGSHVFYDFATPYIQSFEVAEENNYFKSVDGVLFSKDGTRLVAYPASKHSKATYEIPEGVTRIDELAFSRIVEGSSVSSRWDTLILPDSYVVETENQPTNIINRLNGNSLATALYSYTEVTNIQVKSSNPRYTTIDGCLYDKTGTILYYVPTNKTGTLNLNNTTLKIDLGALYGFEITKTSVLSNLTIPRYVQDISDVEIDRLNKFIQIKNKFVDIEPGNVSIAKSGNSIVRLMTILSTGLVSNLKLISSGNVPDTSKLSKGEMAFGIIGSNLELYVNPDGVVRKLISISLVQNDANDESNENKSETSNDIVSDLVSEPNKDSDSNNEPDLNNSNSNNVIESNDSTKNDNSDNTDTSTDNGSSNNITEDNKTDNETDETNDVVDSAEGNKGDNADNPNNSESNGSGGHITTGPEEGEDSISGGEITNTGETETPNNGITVGTDDLDDGSHDAVIVW